LLSFSPSSRQRASVASSFSNRIMCPASASLGDLGQPVHRVIGKGGGMAVAIYRINHAGAIAASVVGVRRHVALRVRDGMEQARGVVRQRGLMAQRITDDLHHPPFRKIRERMGHPADTVI
jgi:hypothetical protein